MAEKMYLPSGVVRKAGAGCLRTSLVIAHDEVRELEKVMIERSSRTAHSAANR